MGVNKGNRQIVLVKEDVPMLQQVTTASGAIYYVDGLKVMGGSKKLKDGKLLYPVRLGDSMLIFTPERLHLNPAFKNPSVLSTPVARIEPLYSWLSLSRPEVPKQ